MSMYVRLVPTGHHRNIKVEGYWFKGNTYRGGPRPTWYLVDDKLAKSLEPLRQNDNDWDSPPLFQIVTEEQKADVENEEQVRYLAKLGIPRSISELPQNFKTSATKDIRSPETKEQEARNLGGRAAAMPPTRGPEYVETAHASIGKGSPLPENRKYMPLLPADGVNPPLLPKTHLEPLPETPVVPLPEIDMNEDDEGGAITTKKLNKRSFNRKRKQRKTSM